MRRVIAFTAIALASGILATVARAQFPPERATNLKVLPTTISMDSLVNTMGGFTRALGVRCAYCHVGPETGPLDQYEFANDRKATKEKARAMLRMVDAINGEHLTKLALRRTPPISVTCATCHRGIAQPRTLQHVLLVAYDAGGPDSLVKEYRSLRERYYGRATYDFGEVALADVASALAQRGRLPDAVRVHALNTEVSPTSGFAWRQAAAAQVALGDTSAAIASLERALGINANDGQARRSLETLRRRP